MKKWTSIILSIILISLIFPSFQSNNKGIIQSLFFTSGILDVNGQKQEFHYVIKNSEVYFPLHLLSNQLKISVVDNEDKNIITLTYSDKREARLNLDKKQYSKDGIISHLEIEQYDGQFYISIPDLETIMEQHVLWDTRTKTLYVFSYTYEKQGQSLQKYLPYQGFSVKGNKILFTSKDLPNGSWSLNGQLVDFRLLETNLQSSMVEYRYAAFYHFKDSTSQLLITQRKLPNGDQMLFLTAFSPHDNQQVKVDMEDKAQVYGSNAYQFVRHGSFNSWPSEFAYSPNETLDLNAGESLNQWFISSKENVKVEGAYLKQAWDTSKDFHKTNTWVTGYGTYRKTPGSYFADADKINREYKYQNLNLQASVPLLLLESLQVKKNRFIEDFIHNARFTLIQNLGYDGYWRAGVNTAYLNYAFGLGPNYIDTRMSVDASLFLIRYGLMFDDQESIEKGTLFKNYFKQLKQKGIAYYLNGGYLYPDYYSEQQRGKTVVSLNHALYEMNYLYTLYNWLGDQEAKKIADEMVKFVRLSKDKWVKPNGDLYYALNPKGEYFGEDYLNVTYIDLFTLQSIFDYMKKDVPEISDLFEEKGNYLNRIESKEIESHLQMEQLYQQLGMVEPKRGSLFSSYPVTMEKANGKEFSYLTYGAYQWIKGINNITYKGKTVNLDPNKKYFILVTKDELYIANGPVKDVKVKNGEIRLAANKSVSVQEIFSSGLREILGKVFNR